MFETLSRRSRSLVDQQLSLIDRLERNEEDPERLESLFRLDHLAARMRRNGANLLVLAGAKVPREQAEPVPVSAIINAAASEVEDYTRVVTATVPDSEIVGSIAGDLVHLLAELLDNALRYSPPISQVRVSAVHTGNGGLVIEVSDIGIGMTESGPAGGQHPSAVRRRGQPLHRAAHGPVRGRPARRTARAGGPAAQHHCGRTEFGHHRRCVRAVRVARAAPGRPTNTVAPEYATPADAHAGIHTALALDEDHDYTDHLDRRATSTSTATPRCPSRCCRSAIPGASGISDIPASLAAPAGRTAGAGVARRGRGRRTRCRRRRPSRPVGPAGLRRAEVAPSQVERPTVDTSAFFAARAQAAGNGAPTPRRSRRRSRRHPAARAAGPGRAAATRAVPACGARSVVDGGLGRRDLPEDAVRMARRSDRHGQERRT